MRKLLLLFPAAGLIASSCGGGFGSGAEGVFDTVILYTSGTDPAYLEADMVNWQSIEVTIYTFDTNTNACDARTVVQFCGLPTFQSDLVQVSFTLEPKRDYAGNVTVQLPSPVELRRADITLVPLTQGCPQLRSVQYLNTTLRLRPGDESVTASVPISVVPHSFKEDVYELFNYIETVVYDERCPDTSAVTYEPVLDRTCEYRADVSVEAVELYTGRKKNARFSVSFRLADYQQQGECMPGSFTGGTP